MKLDFLATVYGNALYRVMLNKQITSRVVGYHRAPRYDRFNLRLKDTSDLNRCLKLEEEIALSAKADRVIITREHGQVVFQFQLPESHCRFYSLSELTKPDAIGVSEKSEIVIDFDDVHAHAKVVGITGSGKSETLKSVAMALIKGHSRDDIQLVMLDPGRDFLNFSNCSHLAMPIAHGETEISNTIDGVYNLLTHRMENRILDDCRLLVMCDEIEGSIQTSEQIAKIEAISKRGRKHKINLCLGGQEFNKPYHSLASQLNNVFIGSVASASISARLSGQAGLQCHHLAGKGDFIHVNGSKAVRFQVAQTTQADFDSLERIEQQPVVSPEPGPVNAGLVEEPDRGGRPKKCVEPSLLAMYVKYGHKITIAKAKKHLELSKNMHNRYKEFTSEFLAEWRKL